MLGEGHPKTLDSMIRLAILFKGQERFAAVLLSPSAPPRFVDLGPVPSADLIARTHQGDATASAALADQLLAPFYAAQTSVASDFENINVDLQAAQFFEVVTHFLFGVCESRESFVARACRTSAQTDIAFDAESNGTWRSTASPCQIVRCDSVLGSEVSCGN